MLTPPHLLDHPLLGQVPDIAALLASRLSDVAGLVSPVEGAALLRWALAGPGDGAVVEIGSLMGLSTLWLAHGCQLAGRGPVHAVDHFRGSPEHQPGGPFEAADLVRLGSLLPRFLANVERHGMADWVVPHVGASTEVAASWHGPIRLLFVDGDHSFEATAADVAAWSPHLAPGGAIVLHDVGGGWEGVTRWHASMLASGAWREAEAAGSVRVMVRAGGDDDDACCR